MQKRYLWILAAVLLVVLIPVGLKLRGPAKIDPQDFRSVRSMILPQFLHANDAQRKLLATTAFTKDVAIAYAIHEGSKYELIATQSLATWKQTKEQLHEIAMQNLRERIKTSDVAIVEGTNGDQFALIETGDGFAAARILDPKVQARLLAVLGSDVVIGVPTQDFAVAWPKDSPLQNKFISQLQEEYAKEESAIHKLTGNVLLLTAGGIRQVEVQPQGGVKL